MQESPPPRPPIPLRRSHLDSATCRAALRILSYCVELESHISPPRLSAVYPGPSSVTVGSGEQPRSASSEGTTTPCATSKEGSNGADEIRGSNVREGRGELAGRDVLEEDGGQEFHSVGESVFGKIPDALIGAGEAHARIETFVENSLREGSGACEIRSEVFDDSRNVLCEKERPCGGSALSDSLAGSSCPMEEVEPQKEEDERGECDSDRFKDKLSWEDFESFISREACPLVNAPGHAEHSRGRTRVSPRNELAGDGLPTEVVYKDPELLLLPTENARSAEESCMEAQVKITDGSGPREVDEHQKIIYICSAEEDEMEEGEIPNKGGISDLSFDLEIQNAANGGIQLEQRDLANDFAEEGNTACRRGAFTAQGFSVGVDFIKEARESGKPVIVEVGLKPQKKKCNDKGTKKDVGNTRKRVSLPNKSTSVDVELEHQKKTKNAVIFKDAVSENVISSSLCPAKESIGDFAIQSEEKSSNVGDAKVEHKRKRAPLTESRKEKKKLSKKRKRAETNRKLGVKRLKLETLSKPKKVIPCSFYQKGRCQKGDSCKFSHDIVPDTKSIPCTFFARGTCLKGDDCPFDHQLSKYPCHNYMSQGRCNRGDDCLFSHKIHIGELSSTASVTRELDSPELSGKQSFQKCLNSNNLSSSAVSASPKNTPPSTKSFIPKDAVEQMKLKEPMKIPKGMCFLTFSKEPAIGMDKPHQAFDLKKVDAIQMNKQGEINTLGKLQNEDKSLSSLQKPLLLVQHNVQIKSRGSVQSLGSNTASSNGSKDIVNEERKVTDASRILEEFLFNGIT